jgi:hypothetical protein
MRCFEHSPGRASSGGLPGSFSVSRQRTSMPLRLFCAGRTSSYTRFLGLALRRVSEHPPLADQPALNLNRSTNLQVCTSLRLTQNLCYQPFSICHSCQLVQKLILPKFLRYFQLFLSYIVRKYFCCPVG